ncbi:hypothetical protein QTP70_016970 [Hemibagrus guttatus]|uniref:Oxysterol-binding protein n=1 Tax=Hemibagrus guttatus TaxID=175788 RepID=A0AAE0R829_9TELE|nr:hypothetical protein QTP70_016970 [Hemibagrus guttatus]
MSNGGWTTLHLASYFGQKDIVEELLKKGLEVNMQNNDGDTALHVAALCGRQKSDFLSWNSHWVVLENGSVSWYCNQSDAACGERRQGYKPLMKAQCVGKSWDKYFFTLKCCDSSVHHFKVSSRCTEPENIRKKWVDAIEEHAVYSALCGNPEETPAQEGEEEVAGEAMDLGDFLSHSLQAAESYQRMLESQVAMFVSMVKNEDNNGKRVFQELLLYKSFRRIYITVPELLKAREICELCSETSSVLRHCVDLLSQREENFCVSSLHYLRISYRISRGPGEQRPPSAPLTYRALVEIGLLLVEEVEEGGECTDRERRGKVGCELEEKERFWSELDEVMESIPMGERVVIGVDFNGHVGEGNRGDEELMGKFGVKERNLEGQMIVDFAKRMDMGVVNTYFQKREEHRVTYKSGDLEKAYDRVPREELWYCMRKSGVAKKYVRVVQDMYERSRTVVRCAVGQTEEFKVEVGLHQGSALSHFLFAIVMDQLSEEVWSVKLEQEVEKNRLLSEALQTLATEHHQLKENLSTGRKSPTLSVLAEDEFYDALSGCNESRFCELGSKNNHTYRAFDDVVLVSSGLTDCCRAARLPAKEARASASMSGEENHGDKTHHNGVKKHRMSLPAPMFSRNDVSIWSILKKCIGMELSKIAMPVIFNEPLSFLQRLTEYMEHTYLIQQANASTDSIQRMKCVAAFAVSAVASQWERTGKPFNPLLGETYELIREDLGFRWMSEQVSHHPPVSAFHAEGLNDDFVFHGSIYPKLKFWGKSVEAEPRGIITLELPKHKEAYTWTNPTCCVHNIIVGQLWIEQYGNVEVINHKTGEKCSLTFKSCGLFGKELHKVEGYIFDKSKKKICAIYGKWTECLYTVDPAAFDLHKKTDKKTSEEKKGSKQSSVDEEAEEMPPPEAETVQVILGSELVWRISPRPENSAQYYAFSTFAMQLNELEEDMKENLPVTDCRLRPDIRALENGDIDSASAEKKRVEEKQRVARKNRSKSNDEWKTRWFQQGVNPHNGGQDWLYSGGYWTRNYSQLPDIY